MTLGSQRTGKMLEERVAASYRKQGFQVLVEPQPKDLPFDLSGYAPDLIVKEPSGKSYLVEIKNSARQMSIERYRDIAETVAQHPGWGFLLVTDDDVGGENKKLLSWDEIKQRQAQAKKLLSLNEPGATFLLAWGAFEALLRQQALRVHIPIENFPTSSLIKHFYSQGELSVEQFDEVTRLNTVRNLYIHGYQTANLTEPANRLVMLVDDLLNAWSLNNQQ
jgi:REase_AHJR-like